MQTKNMRRRGVAAALTGSMLAGAGAIAYFASNATVSGDVSAGDFVVESGALVFTGTPNALYPTTDVSHANRAAALSADMNLSNSAPVAATAVLRTLTATDINGSQADDLWFSICDDGDTDGTNCSPVRNVGEVAAAPNGFRDTFELAATTGSDFDVYVWLEESGDLQDQGVTTTLNFAFDAYTGYQDRGTDFTSAAQFDDGVARFFYDETARPGSATFTGNTISGRVMLHDAVNDAWVPAANHKIRVDISDGYNPANSAMDEESFTLGHFFGTTDGNGYFTFELSDFESKVDDGEFFDTIPNDRPVTMGVTHRLEQDAGTGGFSYLFIPSQMDFDNGDYDSAAGSDDAYSPVFFAQGESSAPQS